MAKIVTITNPLTGQPAQVDQLDHTAQQIDDGLNIARGVSNPNLLDNWYFGNPVNQRGQNEYTNSDSYSYGIDRWICSGIALSDTGITFTESGSFMDQILELAKKVALSGKAVTASVLLDSGELIYGTLQYESSMSEQKFFATENIQIVLLTNGIIRLYSIGNYTAVAAKLELGDQQTLAHQENGVWVLNEIPNYADQLARCQRYFRRYTFTPASVLGNGIASSSTDVALPLYVGNMRTISSVVCGDLSKLKVSATTLGAGMDATGILVAGQSTLGYATVSITVSGSLTAGNPYKVGLIGSYINFIAEL